ncbi:carbon-nitrogen hydrolase family protein [Luteimonas abyssi]|uniref:carbon-nitrogen hydrolase family protein n=1 Tax=Luteimonas abyssi TaxID=1247514 RepID=UPI000737CC2B|nr:carbon-nitrogen hydrolase family protein [Luteimonas abyssi]
MKVAVARYPIGKPSDFAAFAETQRGWLRDAADRGAEIAVLPEFLSLELASVFPVEVSADVPASLAAIQALRTAWIALYRALAVETGMLVLPGTFLLDRGGGRYRNRADVFTPDGMHGWQDKLQLTGFEKQVGTIEGGDALRVFEYRGLRFGVAICYDIEFPLTVRAQMEAGARLILTPSCTDTVAGAGRVRIGCLARALENRCFVAQAVTAGDAPWSPALDVNTGDATVYAPMDVGLPDDGIVATSAGRDGWTLVDVDVDALDASRARAQVANDRDWARQRAPDLLTARVERLI